MFQPQVPSLALRVLEVLSVLHQVAVVALLSSEYLSVLQGSASSHLDHLGLILQICLRALIPKTQKILRITRAKKTKISPLRMKTSQVKKHPRPRRRPAPHPAIRLLRLDHRRQPQVQPPPHQAAQRVTLALHMTMHLKRHQIPLMTIPLR